MCDPVSGSMAFLAVMQTQQQQAAADAQANAINKQFEDNNRMQNEAYTKDMEAYWDEEVNIQEEMFQNAEDASEAKLDMMISARQDASSMMAANAELTGGGQTPQALLGNLRRSQLNSARDLDEEYQRGVVALGGEIEGLQLDKVHRRNQAIGAINSAQRSGYQSAESRLMSLGMAGASAYMSASMMQDKNPFGGTADVTTKPKDMYSKRTRGKRMKKFGGLRKAPSKSSWWQHPEFTQRTSDEGWGVVKGSRRMSLSAYRSGRKFK